MPPRYLFLRALAINGRSTLHGDARGDGDDCLIRPSAIDMVRYDRTAEMVTVTLRSGTTIEAFGHYGEVYDELAAVLDSSICKEHRP